MALSIMAFARWRRLCTAPSSGVVDHSVLLSFCLPIANFLPSIYRVGFGLPRILAALFTVGGPFETLKEASNIAWPCMIVWKNVMSVTMTERRMTGHHRRTGTARIGIIAISICIFCSTVKLINFDTQIWIWWSMCKFGKKKCQT